MNDSLPINTQTLRAKHLWKLLIIFVMLVMASYLYAPRVIYIVNTWLDAGCIIFPFIFLICALITEVYGYKYARLAIWCSLLFKTLLLIYSFAIAHWMIPKFTEQAALYNQLYTFRLSTIFATYLSFIISMHLCAFLVSYQKKRFHGKHLKLRIFTSLFISGATDSILFIRLINRHDQINIAYGVIHALITKYIVFALFFMLLIEMIKKLKSLEKLDIVDVGTKYNIFSLNLTYSQENNRAQTNTPLTTTSDQT